jgi:glutamate-1-semialdehyde 2,1-aminomutase
VTATEPSHQASDSLYEQALRALPGGNSRTTLFLPPHPPYAARGEGFRLVDADGHTTIDLQNNYTALIHGHAHPRIVAAATAAIADGTSFGLPTAHEVELAAELARRVPAGERWRFANSGTEAVMMAIRLARAATGRELVLRFAGAYHGSADAVIDGGGAIVVPVGDQAALDATLERDGECIACVIFDAMPNRAGLRPAEPDFVAHLRDATSARGIVLIQDEVLTFRLETGGLHARYGLQPDLVTLGKIIGGGFPVGAVGGRADLMARFDPRTPGNVPHGGTFSANPVTMRAGLAALELYDADDIARLNALGDELRTELAEQGWTVTGSGSLLRIHTPEPEQTWWRLYRAGVTIAINGLACLSTPMDESTVAAAADAFAKAAR